MQVSPRRSNEIVLGKRAVTAVTADAAVQLAAALGTSERFRLGMQADHDLEKAHRALGDTASRMERLAARGGRRRLPTSVLLFS